MTAFRILLSLLPWAVFSVLAHRDAQAIGIAALGGVVVGALLMARNRSGGVKLVDVTAVLSFGTIFVVAFAGGTGSTEWLAEYGRGVSTLVLGVVLLISAVTAPFTAEYAKEVVPCEQWATAKFKATNRRVSALWGFLVLVVGAAHLFAARFDQALARAGDDWLADLLLNWVLVLVLVLIGVKATDLLTRAPADRAGAMAQHAVVTDPAPRAGSR